MNKTKISWCDYTWNVVSGCTKIAKGCVNCYAETIANRFWKDRKFSDVQCHPEKLNEPSKIKKPSLIFVNSMSDLFHKDVSHDFLISCFSTMSKNQKHKFLILTKRVERMSEFINWWYRITDEKLFSELTSNIWLGVSVSTQDDFNKLVPELLKVPVAHRFISIEPQIERIDLLMPLGHLSMIDWVIVGAESGAKKRYCDSKWIEGIVSQCKGANVPVFVKQVHHRILEKPGKFELIKEINHFPKHLQIQQFPKELK